MPTNLGHRIISPSW